MSMEITKKYLEDLENRIDDSVETDLLNQWLTFVNDDFKGDIFIPKRKKVSKPSLNWPEIGINETLDDFEKMILHQFKICSDILQDHKGQIMAVRCNYGTSIIPSLFGVKLFVMDEEFNTLPTSFPFSEGKKDVKKAIDKGVPNIYGGLGEKVFQMGERFVEIQKEYPQIGKHLYIYHPDAQGPMDICEVLWGSNLFLDIIDDPNLVHEFLELITDTYIKFMKEWNKVVPFNNEYSIHWWEMHKGNILLRDDSAMNFSPEMFEEFIKPYDQKILSALGGGALHFCGKGDHYIEYVSEMEGLYSVNVSQPEYNNMEIIYKNTIDKGIKLLDLERSVAENTLKNGRSLNSNVHCW